MSEHTTSERCEAGITALRRQGPEDGPDRDGDGHPCRLIVGKCICGCHWAPSCTTRSGVRVSW
jgi:hypothetical protein